VIWPELTSILITSSDPMRLTKAERIPDEVILPSGAELAAHRDAALARAITLAGRPVTPEEVGDLFPIERW
jgi:hypothetical protein